MKMLASILTLAIAVSAMAQSNQPSAETKTKASKKSPTVSTNQNLKSIKVDSESLKGDAAQRVKSMQQMGGGQEGNGGGGIFKDGRYMTFGSAGMFVEPVDLTAADIPAVAQTIHFFMQTSILSSATKVKWLSAIRPDTDRKYYKVKADQFNKTTYDRIVAEYARATNVDMTNLTLFAVTDTKINTTYLLPSFFKLTLNEQMAIVLHEAAWLLNPQAAYEKIIQAEVSFQNYLSNPMDVNKSLQLIQNIGSDADRMQFYVLSDLQTGALNGLLERDRRTKMYYIPMAKLMSADFVRCRSKSRIEACQDQLVLTAMSLSAQYPNSLLLKAWADAVIHKQAYSQYLGNGPSQLFVAEDERGEGYTMYEYPSEEILKGEFCLYYDNANQGLLLKFRNSEVALRISQ